jgi:hypothetical protein
VQFSQKLPRQNPGCHKEEQFLGCYGNGGSFEQIADQGHAAEQWYLIDVRCLIADDHTAYHYGATIINQYLGLGRLRIEGRSSVNASDAVIDLGIFHSHVQEYSTVCGVTSSLNTASIIWTETVLFTVV